jgi:pimeloyl-ACP methyl ester carboxylesterase
MNCRSRGLARRVSLTAALVCALTIAASAAAQRVADLQAPKSPLVIKEMGSFMVGGRTVTQSAGQLSSFFGPPLENPGQLVTDQMYVQYMVPQHTVGSPVVMLHGATLSGKTYETTPDGRMGWYEYFVRKGHAVYVPDQVSRGRSGLDIATYNDVRTGSKPPGSLPNAFRQSNELNWKVMRFGPSYPTPFPDELFPVAAADEFAKQAVPDFNAGLPTPNPTIKALSDLAAAVKGAVIMGHSESGHFPLEAALTDITGIKGLILVEPGRCGWTPYTDEQIATLTRVPILIVFGDHLDTDTGMKGFSWKDAYDQCSAFMKRVNEAHGNAKMLYTPDLGIHGNSHMIMQDKNNLQIADLILRWLDRNTSATLKARN